MQCCGYTITVRQAAGWLGAAVALFSVPGLLAPRFFARWLGLPLTEEPASVVAIRSVGVRDIAIGTALWWSASHQQDYRPWLLARLVSDCGDTVAVGMAVGRGSRSRGFLALGALALAAAVTGGVLFSLSEKPYGAPRAI